MVEIVQIEMESITEQVTQVTCAIITNNGKILAALRSRQMSQSWKWEFPGGKIDDGETAHDCIKREISEELDVDIEVVKSLTPTKHTYPDKSIELYPFICTIKSGEVKAVEHEKVCWFEVDELKSLNWAEADKAVVEEYISYSRSKA